MKKFNPLNTQNLSDYRYYNFKIRNSQTAISDYSKKRMVYLENLSKAFIEDTDKYQVAISKFTISSKNLPIAYCPIIPTRAPYLNLNGQKTPFIIGLQYMADIKWNYLYYINRNDTPIPPAPDPNLNGGEWFSDAYKIWSYSQIVEMLNTTMQFVFGMLAAPPVGSIAPRFYFNPKDQLLYLIVDKTFYDSGLANPIKIYMNHRLYNDWIDGGFLINYNASDPTNHQEIEFLINSVPENTVGNICSLSQDYVATANVFPITDLIISSDMINVRLESGNSINLHNENVAQTVLLKSPVMVDFGLDIQKLSDIRNQITYFPSKLRWHTMKDKPQLDNLDLKIIIRYKNGYEAPLCLHPNSETNLQLCFRKRKKIY